MGMEDEGCHGDVWLDQEAGVGGRDGVVGTGLKGWWSLPVPRP